MMEEAGASSELAPAAADEGFGGGGGSGEAATPGLHEPQDDDAGPQPLGPKNTAARRARRHPCISRGRRFWAALRRSPMDPASQRPICFSYNRGLLENDPLGGCRRAADECRFAHVPLNQVPGAEDAAAILAIEVARSRAMGGAAAAGAFDDGDEGSSFDYYDMPPPPPPPPPRRRMPLQPLGKVMMPLDPETQRRICFFYNSMPTGCMNGGSCPFMHSKVDLRALGFQGVLPEDGGRPSIDASAHTDTEAADSDVVPPIHPAPAGDADGGGGDASPRGAHSPSRGRPPDLRRGMRIGRSRSTHGLNVGSPRYGHGGGGGGGYAAGAVVSYPHPSSSHGYWSPTHAPAPPPPPPPPRAVHYPYPSYAPAPKPSHVDVYHHLIGSPPGVPVPAGWEAGYHAGEYEYPVPPSAYHPHPPPPPEATPAYGVGGAAPYGFEVAPHPISMPHSGGYWPAPTVPAPPPPPMPMQRHMTYLSR